MGSAVEVLDQYAAASQPYAINISDSEYYAQNLGLHTVLRLHDTVTSETHTVKPLCVFAYDPNLILIGTREDGVYRFETSKRSWEYLGGKDVVKNVSILKTDRMPSNSVLYAAADGGIFRSTDMGETWNIVVSLSDPVTDMTVTPQGNIFVIIKGEVFLIDPVGLKSYTYQNGPPIRNATAIDCTQEFPGIVRLFIGTPVLGLLELVVDERNPLAAVLDRPTYFENNTINAIQATPFSTDYSAAMIFNQDAIHLHPRYWPFPTVRAYGIAQSINCFKVFPDVFGQDQIIIGTDRGFVFLTLGASVNYREFTAGAVSKIEYWRYNNTLVALTSEGMIWTTDGGFTWKDMNKGLETTIPRGVTLLQSTMYVGDFWPAADITVGGPGSLPVIKRIIARVLGHYEVLQPAGQTYTIPDVLAIRYAEEDAAGNPLTNTQYTLIYYARNTGPVLIEDVMRDAASKDMVIRRTTRSRPGT